MNDERDFELDKKIALLLGWYWDDHRAISPEESKNARTDSTGNPWWWLPYYSSNMSDALQVMEYVFTRFQMQWTILMHGARYTLPRDYIPGQKWMHDKIYRVELAYGPEMPFFSEESDYLPLAICRVAIKGTEWYRSSKGK